MYCMFGCYCHVNVSIFTCLHCVPPMTRPHWMKTQGAIRTSPGMLRCSKGNGEFSLSALCKKHLSFGQWSEFVLGGFGFKICFTVYFKVPKLVKKYELNIPYLVLIPLTNIVC